MFWMHIKFFFSGRRITVLSYFSLNSRPHREIGLHLEMFPSKVRLHSKHLKPAPPWEALEVRGVEERSCWRLMETDGECTNLFLIVFLVMDVSTMTSSEFNKFADRGFATETLSETKQAPPPAHSSVGYGQPAGFGYPPPSNGASSAFQSTSVAPKPSNYGAGSMQQGVVAAPSTVGGMNNNRGGLNSNMGGMGAAPIGGMNNNMGGMGYSSVGGMNNMGGMGAAPMGGMNNNMGGMGMNNNMGGMGAPMGGMNNNMGMSAYNMGGMNNMGMNGGMNGGMGTQQYNSSGMTPNYNAPMNSGGSYAAAPQKKQEPDPFASLINF